MKAPRARSSLMPRGAARLWSSWVAVPKASHELRALQRRVAAARLGVNSPTSAQG
jgi:hypothetical protein